MRRLVVRVRDGCASEKVESASRSVRAEESDVTHVRGAASRRPKHEQAYCWKSRAEQQGSKSTGRAHEVARRRLRLRKKRKSAHGFSQSAKAGKRTLLDRLQRWHLIVTQVTRSVVRRRRGSRSRTRRHERRCVEVKPERRSGSRSRRPIGVVRRRAEGEGTGSRDCGGGSVGIGAEVGWLTAEGEYGHGGVDWVGIGIGCWRCWCWCWCCTLLRPSGSSQSGAHDPP